MGRGGDDPFDKPCKVLTSRGHPQSSALVERDERVTGFWKENWSGQGVNASRVPLIVDIQEIAFLHSTGAESVKLVLDLLYFSIFILPGIDHPEKGRKG